MKLFNTLFFLLLSVSILAQNYNPDVISKRLQNQLHSDDGYHHISILLSDRVDVRSIDEVFYQQKATLEERAFTLITSLKDKAATTQNNLLSFLYQNQAVDQASINSYWISNIIFLKAKKEVIHQLSLRNDIEWMDINAKLELTEYENIDYFKRNRTKWHRTWAGSHQRSSHVEYGIHRIRIGHFCK